MALNDIKVPKENASGTFDEVVLTGALAPSDIGAQSLFDASSQIITANTTLAAARARKYTIQNYDGNTYNVVLPTTGVQSGDIAIVLAGTLVGSQNIRKDIGGGNFTTIATLSNDQSYRFVYTSSSWSIDPVYTHTHPASAISDSTTAGRALLTGADAAAQRTSLGLGTAATSASGDFAAASHSHGNINSSGQVGSTAGLPLKTGTAGVVEAGAFGTSAGTFCEGNDARLSNARTPTAHTHAASDITSGLAASATTDTTNASNISSGTLATARMGSGTPSASNYLRGDGSWQTVTAGVGGSTGATDNALLRADGTGGAAVQDSALVIDDATTSPQNNVALRNNHSETNSAIVITGKGTGSLIWGPKPDGTAVGGNSRGSRAVDLQPTRDSAARVASGTNAFAIGHSNLASGTRSFAGGTNCTASAESSFAFGDASSCSGAYGGMAVGDTCSVTGFSSAAFGFANTSSGNYSFSAGHRNTASGASGAIALGANGSATINGQFAFSSGRPSASGVAQFTVFTLYGNTTGTGTTELFGGADQGGAVRLSVPSGHIMHGLVHIIGTKNDGLTVATYSRQVAIKNVGGTTSLVGSVTLVGADLASGTSISITANDTNDALKIDCTGPTAGETWRWIALCEFAQRTYAN